MQFYLFYIFLYEFNYKFTFFFNKTNITFDFMSVFSICYSKTLSDCFKKRVRGDNYALCERFQH
jgi:hypothetical protein